MRLGKAWVAAVLALVLCMAPVVQAEPSQEARNIIRELCSIYCWSPETAEARMAPLIQQLIDMDPETAGVWLRILNYWDFVNTDLELNYDVLPDGLVPTDALCIIVMGFELNPDGSMRQELIRRLEVALASARKYPNAFVMCTGGAATGYGATEAGKMGQWLLENGLEEERLIIEETSMNTTENALNCREILVTEYPQVTNVAIVTSDYHLPWAIVLFDTAFVLNAEEISVVSNAVAEITNHDVYNIRNCQRGGILDVAGLYH